jgi:hypothetical protein
MKDIRLTTDQQDGHYNNDLNRPLHVHFQGEDNLCHLIICGRTPALEWEVRHATKHFTMVWLGRFLQCSGGFLRRHPDVADLGG